MSVDFWIGMVAGIGIGIVVIFAFSVLVFAILYRRSPRGNQRRGVYRDGP